VTGTTATSPAGASLGTLITSDATCAAGKVLLGGGAYVTNSDTAELEKVGLQSSYPSSTTTWTATAVVTGAKLGGGDTISVTAYALCSL